MIYGASDLRSPRASVSWFAAPASVFDAVRDRREHVSASDVFVDAATASPRALATFLIAAFSDATIASIRSCNDVLSSGVGLAFALSQTCWSFQASDSEFLSLRWWSPIWIICLRFFQDLP